MVVFKNQNNLTVASVCFYKGKTKFKSYQISKKALVIKRYDQSAWNYWKSKMGREKLIVDEKKG